jgi:hypothetical protein
MNSFNIKDILFLDRLTVDHNVFQMKGFFLAAGPAKLVSLLKKLLESQNVKVNSWQ